MAFKGLCIPRFWSTCSAGGSGIKGGRIVRSLAAATVLAGLLGCADSRMGGTLDRILPDPRDFGYGAIASDEPSATIAARDILQQGGTAADAAVGMYFTLAVTAPSVASLGAGGVCLVHDPVSGKVEVLDFIAPASVNAASGAHPTAVPTVVRGMAALHGRFGRLPWSELLRHAEQLARSGHTVAGRLADDLSRASGRIFVDERTRRQFADQAGAPLRAGDAVRQVELGSIIGQVRGRGAGSFYAGPLAARIVESVRMAGGSLTITDLHDYLPKWRAPVSAYSGREQMHTVGPPATAGLVAAQMWQMLVTDDRYAKAAAEERPHVLAEAARRALSQRGQWASGSHDPAGLAGEHLSAARARELLADYDPAAATGAGQLDGAGPVAGGSGFVVADGTGMAVACTVTLNALFGIGRMAPGTGIFPASAAIEGASLLGPVMITRPADRTFRMAVAGAGGVADATATAQLAARALLEKQPLEKAMAAPRLHPAGPGAALLTEAGEDHPAVRGLSRRGHAVRGGHALGRLNAVLCSSGLPADSVKWSDCSAAADPRGRGLARVFLFERG